jgi:hypothetical protein
MGSFSDICENFRVRSLSVVAWNLFWWDCRSVREELAISGGGSYLEVSQLRELLPAVVQQAGERLRVLVGDFVRADVAALGEALLADITGEGLFAGMAALMGLEVPQLGKTLATRGLFADKRLVPGMRPHMNVEMGLLRKALPAVRQSAGILALLA